MAQIKVRFMGIADERIIHKKDFEAAGVKVDRDIIWSRRNNFAVMMDSTDALEELLRAQGHFKIEKVNDDNTSSAVVEPADVDNEGDVIKDGTTGATSRVAKATAEQPKR